MSAPSPSQSKLVQHQLDGGLIMTDFDKNVSLLQEMGIAEDLASWALIEKSNDVAEAVDLATNMNTDDHKKFAYYLITRKVQKEKQASPTDNLTSALNNHMPGVPPPSRQLKPSQRVNSEDMVQHWVKRGRSNPFPPEYQRANDQICIQPFLMAKTVLHKKLEELNRIADQKPLQQGDTFTYSLLVAIKKAYNLSSDSHARRHFIHGRQDQAVDFQGYPFQECQLYLQSLPPWQQRYLHIALRELVRTEDAMGLQLILGLMMRGARECDARKRWVFSTLIRRVGSAKEEVGNGPACDVDGRLTVQAATIRPKSPDNLFSFMKTVFFPGVKEDVPPPPPPAPPQRLDSLTTKSKPVVSGVTLAQAKERLYNKLEEAIDDVKERAFKTVFLEPTACYFHAIRDGIMEGDVEVHGSNTYAAILLAALGIRLPRAIFLHDEAKGIVKFLDAGMEDMLRDSLWKVENLGKGWQSTQKSREFGERGQVRPTQTNEFYFGGACYGHLAWQVGNACVDPSLALTGQRRELAKYLEQYTYYFREDVILQRLYSDLMQDPSDKASLDIVFEQGVKGLHPEWVNGEVDDINYWIWDEDDYSFLVDNARKLFALLGVAKLPDS